MTHTLGVMHGDGIGREVVPAALGVLDACEERTGLDVETLSLDVGMHAYEETGSSLPADTLSELADCDGWLLGPLLVGEYPDDDEGPRSPSGRLRTAFDLYANVRPVRSYEHVGPDVDVDVTVVRQNTEGFYADRNLEAGSGEFMPTNDLAMSLRVVTRRESRRIAERAFEHARRRDSYDTVTCVHKSNVLGLGDGLFLEEVETVAEQYPDVAFEEILVDACATELARAPFQFDVLVTTNMYGDILSDEAAGVAGSLGLAPGLNAGDDYAMAQATHGAAPDIAGRGVANPTAMIRSTALLLEWLGRRGDDPAAVESASLIEAAVAGTLREGDPVTPDLGGDASTETVAGAIVDRLRRSA